MSGCSRSQESPSTYAVKVSRLVNRGTASSTERRRNQYSSSNIRSNFSWVKEAGTFRIRSSSPLSSTVFRFGSRSGSMILKSTRTGWTPCASR